MKTRTLQAIKPHKYGTRHLTAGDEYEAPPRHAIALVAARKARFADDKPAQVAEEARATATPELQREPKPESEPAETPASIDGLRLQATALGINVDGRWGVTRLQYEIAQAQAKR